MTAGSQPPKTLSNTDRWRIITGVAGATVIADQFTKWLAIRTLSDGPNDIAPTLRFKLAHNSGFSFSTGSGFGPVIGVAVTIIVALLIIRLVRETSPRRVVLFAAILGGAIGNLADRVFRTDGWPLSGEVVDFIDVSWYAVFNVADAVLVTAVILFIATEYMEQRH